MKVKISNKSNKKRAKSSMKELKEFAIQIANELQIVSHIDLINLTYKKTLNYYKPKQPLYGFHKLFHDNVVTIDFAQNWDKSQVDRKMAIAHELVHVKQMIEKRLVIGPKLDTAFWNGEIVTSWKKFRWKEFLDLDYKKRALYLKKTLPWEREVSFYIKKFVK